MGQRRALTETPPAAVRARLPASPSKRLARAVLAAWLAAAAGCSAPTPPDALLVEAREAIAVGDSRTAQIHLRNALQQDPNHAPARALFGEVLLAAGDAAGAEHNLRRAAELGGDATALHSPLLRALLAQGKFRAVLDEIAHGPTLTGEAGITSLRIAGAAHRGLNELEAAEAAYRLALESDAESLATRIELAQVLVEAGRFADARAYVEPINAEHPDHVPALLVRGAIDAAEGLLAPARERFERAVEIVHAQGDDARLAPALGPLIEVQLAQGDVAGAVGNVDRLLALAPGDPVSEYLKARVDVQQGNVAAAERRLEALVTQAPTYAPAYVLLGSINVAQGQLGQATMYLRSAVNRAPRSEAARLLLAEAYLRQHKVVEAREVLVADGTLAGTAAARAGQASLAAGQPTLAAELFDLSEQPGPTNLRELVELASAYIAAGELDRSLRLLEAAPIDRPDSAPVVSYLLTLVQARRGDLAAAASTAERLAGDFPDAVAPLMLRAAVAANAADLTGSKGFYEAALLRDEAYVPALLGLARVAAAQGNRDEAQRHVRRALEIDPRQLDTLIGMAEVALRRRDFVGAELWLSGVPESARRSRLQAIGYYEQGMFPAAADAFARAFRLQPSGELAVGSYFAAREASLPEPEALLVEWSRRHPDDVRVAYTLATHELEEGDHEAAIRLYEVVLARDPRHSQALNNLAWLYDERGDERALELAERARQLLPQDPSVADTLGWLHVRRGAASVGRPLLEEAVRARPEEPEVLYHFAVALAETGATDAAVRELRALLEQSADFASRAAAEERLARLQGAGSR